VALALAFLLLVGRYYAFYHLDGPGAAMGLLLVALPAAALAAAAVALGVRRRALRLGASTAGASARGIGAAALLLVLLLALEVWRTAGLRSGEGPGTGDLAPFVRTLLGR
jgi:hypothetical protein